MLTEQKIKSLIVNIVTDLDGFAPKNGIVDWFRRNYPLDKNDLMMSPSRKNEEKFVQRIGNIISHKPQGKNLVIFPEGFGLILDETANEWIFYDPGSENVLERIKNRNKTQPSLF